MIREGIASGVIAHQSTHALYQHATVVVKGAGGWVGRRQEGRVGGVKIVRGRRPSHLHPQLPNAVDALHQLLACRVHVRVCVCVCSRVCVCVCVLTAFPKRASNYVCFFPQSLSLTRTGTLLTHLPAHVTLQQSRPQLLFLAIEVQWIDSSCCESRLNPPLFSRHDSRRGLYDRGACTKTLISS